MNEDILREIWEEVIKMPKVKVSTKVAVSKEEVNCMIRKKAQELYEKSGRKSGRDMENWLEAERIVNTQLKRTC
jgi:hypothetical protein